MTTHKEPQGWEDKLQDDFMDFWDSHKEALGLGSYSDEILRFWLSKLSTAYVLGREEERKRLLEEIEKMKRPEGIDQPIINSGYNQALDDVLSITND